MKKAAAAATITKLQKKTRKIIIATKRTLARMQPNHGGHSQPTTSHTHQSCPITLNANGQREKIKPIQPEISTDQILIRSL